MILNRVELDDFMSHKKTMLDLGYGINVIVGPNGAGKTSILDAISFALFNDYSSRGKKENLINSKAKRCKVMLDFTEGGIKYNVEWTMGRNKAAQGSLFRLQNGERQLMTRGGERAVVPEIEKILGMDKNLFLQSVYVRQGEIEELVTVRPGDRKELITRLLGVEDLQKAWENIKSVIQEYHDMQITLETELAQRSSIEKKKREYEAKSKELETNLTSKRQELSKIDVEIDNLQTVLDDFEENKERFEELDKQKGILENEIKNAQNRLEKEKSELDKTIEAEERMKQLEDEVNSLPLLEEYLLSLTEKDKQESIQKTLQEKLNSIEKLRKTLQENEENHALYSEKDKTLTEKRIERKKYEGADVALTEASKHLQDYEKEEVKKSAELEKELEKCPKILGEQVNVEDVATLLERKRQEFQNVSDQLEERIKENNESIGILQHRLRELDANLTRFLRETEVKACPICDTELTRERVAQLITKFSLEKDVAEGELTASQKESSEAAEEKKQIESRLRKMASIEPERIRDLVEQLKETREKLAHQKAKAEDLQQQSEALTRVTGEVERLERETSELEEARQKFEFAQCSLDALPLQEEVQAELTPIAENLKALFESVKETIEKLGYEPEEPEKKLKYLRRKKEEYDQNAPMARRKPEYESTVAAITQELSGAEQKQTELIEAIKKLGYSREEHAKKQEEFDSRNESKNGLEKMLAGMESERRTADAEALSCEKELELLKGKAGEKKKVDAFIGILNRIRDAYGKDGIQKIIRAKARPLLEKSTRDLFERFNLEYSDIRIDDDYNISVIGQGGEQDIDQISGGERVALAIALRLAIARVLSGKVEAIIMDEPTTHLDEERRKELVSILNSFFREGGRIIPQMLIITHHPEIEDVADIIYAVRKNEGYSIAETNK
jgi:exonuclease SbcC